MLLTNHVLAKKVYEGLLTGQQVVDAAEAFFMNVLLGCRTPTSSSMSWPGLPTYARSS